MRRLFAFFCAALLLCAGCASQSKTAALSPEEFMAYPADGEPLSPADAQGEITINKSGVSLGFQSAPSDAYASADFSSKRGIKLGSTLEELAEAYPDLRFHVIYGQSEDFKVKADVPLKTVARQAKSGKDIMFLMYTQRSIDGSILSDKEFDAYCEKNGIDGAALSSDPGAYGYECWGMIFGIDGEAVDSLSFTAVLPKKEAQAAPQDSGSATEVSAERPFAL